MFLYLNTIDVLFIILFGEGTSHIDMYWYDENLQGRELSNNSILIQATNK